MEKRGIRPNLCAHRYNSAPGGEKDKSKMPIYEYRCQECGEELEKLQRMNDDPLKDCPACGKAALKRLISAAGFRLKGAGWYETDFKSGNKRNLADSGEKPAKSKDSGDSGGDKAAASGSAGKSASSKSPNKSTTGTSGSSA